MLAESAALLAQIGPGGVHQAAATRLMEQSSRRASLRADCATIQSDVHGELLVCMNLKEDENAKFDLHDAQQKFPL